MATRREEILKNLSISYNTTHQFTNYIAARHPFEYDNVDAGMSAIGVLTENKDDRVLPVLSDRSQTSFKLLHLDIRAVN